MLFTQRLAAAIAKQDKTQTRRPIKPADTTVCDQHGNIVEVRTNGRLKHAIGSIRTVQYAYGKPCRWYRLHNGELLPYADYRTYLLPSGKPDRARLRDAGWQPLKIEITRIRSEDVRNISDIDVHHEALEDVWDFWKIWCGFYDKNALDDHGDVWSDQLEMRPDNRYQAFAYNFNLYRENANE